MELKLKDVTKRYGDKTALHEFSYVFTPGLYGILGANGAGKSTLMNLITDNVKRDEGTIIYDGEEILKMGEGFRRLLGYMPQKQGLYEGMTAEAFLTYMGRLKEIKGIFLKTEIDRVLELTNLKERRHDRIGSFSGGMKQRVLLAQAMMGNPKILILDEPSAGLDPKERVRLRNYIAAMAQEKIVLLATHIVSDVETVASDILLMKEGKLVKSGAPGDLLNELKNELAAGEKHCTLEDVYLRYLGEDDE